MTNPVHRRFALHRSGAAICLAVVSMVAFAPIALGQDQSAATSKDAIVARKTAMDTLSDRMDTIEAMIASGKKIDLDAAHMDADTISVFLMAFPHLFPASTNEWKPNVDKDPATDTFASPDVWSKFADFYRQSAAASKAAYDASRASDETVLKAAVARLRTECNACHAAYLKMD
jgi:cytochrome c556